MTKGLRLIPGSVVAIESIEPDPVVFLRNCVDAFVAS